MINNKGFYQSKEVEGRARAKQLFGHLQHMVEVENESAPIDLSGGTEAKYWYMEVKTRDMPSTRFKTDYLEEKKVKLMVAHCKDPKGKYIYLNLFTDGVARLYYLNRINKSECRIETILLDKTTAEDKGKVEKIIYHLPTHLAKTFKEC